MERRLYYEYQQIFTQHVMLKEAVNYQSDLEMVKF